MTTPQPVSGDTLRNKMRQWDANLIEADGRSLESAVLVRGNFRVGGGGSVIIERGGTLKLVDGNLILGEGKIEGRALAEQLEAVNIDKTSAVTYPAAVGKSTSISVDATAPDWASSATILITGVTTVSSTSFAPQYLSFLNVNSTQKIKAFATFGYIGSRSITTAVTPYFARVDAASALKFTVGIERADDSWISGGQALTGLQAQIQIQGVVIWQR